MDTYYAETSPDIYRDEGLLFSREKAIAAVLGGFITEVPSLDVPYSGVDPGSNDRFEAWQTYAHDFAIDACQLLTHSLDMGTRWLHPSETHPDGIVAGLALNLIEDELQTRKEVYAQVLPAELTDRLALWPKGGEYVVQRASEAWHSLDERMRFNSHIVGRMCSKLFLTSTLQQLLSEKQLLVDIGRERVNPDHLAAEIASQSPPLRSSAA